MAVKTIELTINICDSIYDKIKNLSKDVQIKFYGMQASSLNKNPKKVEYLKYRVSGLYNQSLSQADHTPVWTTPFWQYTA